MRRGLPPFDKRHVEQLLLGEPFENLGQCSSDGGRIAGQQAAQHVDRGAVIDVAMFFVRRSLSTGRGREDQPAGARRFRRTWR